MILSILFLPLLFAADPPTPEIWNFDRLDKIGGHTTTVLGHPKVILTPKGKAIEFNGVDDAIFVDVHPLAGAAAFTWEVIFKPYSSGKPEQRFFHMQSRVPEGTNNRLLFETRLIDGKWCLDSFAASDAGSKPLIDRTKLHTLDEWHHVAQTYDGKMYRHYIDGLLQGEAEVKLSPQGKGQTSIGTRINKVNYFTGAVLKARMLRQAISPDQFMKP